MRHCGSASRRPAGPAGNSSADRSQGVQLATIQELARYWATDYDWRKCEAKLTALPQFTTEIDGADIHFIHVKSPHRGALPLIMTHGWPGSVHRAARDRRPAHRPDRPRRDAPGRLRPGAAVPARLRLLRRAGRGRLGPRPHRARLGGADAPPRLHPLRRPGRRPGRLRQRRDGPPGTRRAARHPPQLAPAGCSAPRPRKLRGGTRGARPRSPRSTPAATPISSSRPPGRRRSATPCWIHPSPWPPGCSTTTPTATTRSPARSSTTSPRAISPGTGILDNITLYWLTGTGPRPPGSTGRMDKPPLVRPGRLLRRSRSRSASPCSPARSPGPAQLGREAYPTLTYFNEVDRGGHFAAWEEPELFATEIRAAFRSLR